ncbi:MAG: PD40 domain-containing protein, partial [Anaerolineae bacterium]|nr:PD40 domain-containing protein [Anaerolineae bacterium]
MAETKFQNAQRRRSQIYAAPLFIHAVRGAGLLTICCAVVVGLALVAARTVPSGWLSPVIVSPAPNVTQMYLLDLDRMLLGPLRDVFNPNRDPAMSPDRRTVLYSASLSTAAFGGGEIVLRDVATGRERRLTEDAFPDSSPDWSPDRRAVIFVSLRSFNTDLYLLDLATGVMRRLTDATRPDFDPAWSPDGQRIAYVSYDDENDSDLFLLDPACDGICGQSARQLIDDPGYDLQPVWS